MIDIEESVLASKRQNAEGMVKTWEDLYRYQAAIELAEPDLILECGTFSGGSAAWFQYFAPVVTIDLNDHNIETRHSDKWNDRVRMLIGSSTSPDVINRVKDLSWRRRVLVSLDSDHSGPHVYNEIVAYQDLVPVGSYIVVEDGILRYLDPKEQAVYNGNPLDAIERFLSETDCWVNDTEIEGMYSQTQHLGGWLRRVK